MPFFSGWLTGRYKKTKEKARYRSTGRILKDSIPENLELNLQRNLSTVLLVP